MNGSAIRPSQKSVFFCAHERTGITKNKDHSDERIAIRPSQKSVFFCAHERTRITENKDHSDERIAIRPSQKSVFFYSPGISRRAFRL